MWLDGAYLGDPEGYFFPHSFDITDLSRFDEEHVLAVEVTCAPQGDPRSRRNITGVLQQSEWFDRSYNPGGLWRPVRLYDTGPVRIDRLRVLCRDADARRAHLRLTARLDSDAQRPVVIRTMIDGHPHAETTQVVASGQNDLEWSIDLTDPALWWPRSLGDQPLTMVTVEVLRRRRAQRSPTAAHRAPPGELGRLGLLGQRRAALPQGRQPAADEQQPRRRPPDA